MSRLPLYGRDVYNLLHILGWGSLYLAFKYGPTVGTAYCIYLYVRRLMQEEGNIPRRRRGAREDFHVIEDLMLVYVVYLVYHSSEQRRFM